METTGKNDGQATEKNSTCREIYEKNADPGQCAAAAAVPEGSCGENRTESKAHVSELSSGTKFCREIKIENKEAAPAGETGGKSEKAEADDGKGAEKTGIQRSDAASEKERREEEKNKRFYRRAHRVFAGLFRFFLRIRVIGRENFPKEGGCLVCINHISAADVIVAAAVCPRQLRYMAKAELFRIPVLGWLIRRLGACPLDRGGADVTAIRKSIALLKEGELVALFPQGHRQPGKNPADTPIRAGAGMIAHHAECPVLPVCIRMKNQRYAWLRRVEILVGTPIPYAELGLADGGGDAYRRATEKVFAEICRLGGFVKSGAEASEACLPDKIHDGSTEKAENENPNGGTKA